MKPLQHIIGQYFTDEYGNPQAEHFARTYTVSPVYNQVSLEGIADQHIGVDVIKPDNMYQVFNMDEISETSYYVKDYKTVYFHSSMAGKDVTIEYFNIGLEYLGADRIYTDIDAKGNILETLADLLEKFKSAKETLQSLNNIGDVDYLIQKLERYILRCGQLHNSMEIELIKTERVRDDMSNLVEEGKQVITRGLEMGVFDNQELQRKENEKERIDEFNIWRKQEENRQSNETERIKNENIRIKNENDRIEYTNNKIKPYMKKVEEWNDYFKEVAPELEKKYTVRLNAVEKESSENVINTTQKLEEYQNNINSFQSNVNEKIDNFQKDINKNISAFKEGIKQENKDFTDLVNSKIQTSDSDINDFKKNIQSQISSLKETINKKIKIPADVFIENSSLQNDFLNVDSDKLRYYKTINNEIVISGSLTGGVNNSIITILPENIRPKNEVVYQIIVEKNNNYENRFIKIQDSGEIFFIGDVKGLTKISLQGIRFRGVN